MNIKQNTAILEAILAQINNLPEAGTGDVATQNGAIGSFTLSSNLTASAQTHAVSVGFAPSIVVVFRRSWVRGTQSINAAFNGAFTFSICSTASSSKAVEKLVGSSYITKGSDGFTIAGDSTYYWVAGVEYIYVAVP